MNDSATEVRSDQLLALPVAAEDDTHSSGGSRLTAAPDSEVPSADGSRNTGYFSPELQYVTLVARAPQPLPALTGGVESRPESGDHVDESPLLPPQPPPASLVDYMRAHLPPSVMDSGRLRPSLDVAANGNEDDDGVDEVLPLPFVLPTGDQPPPLHPRGSSALAGHRGGGGGGAFAPRRSRFGDGSFSDSTSREFFGADEVPMRPQPHTAAAAAAPHHDQPPQQPRQLHHPPHPHAAAAQPHHPGSASASATPRTFRRLSTEVVSSRYLITPDDASLALDSVREFHIQRLVDSGVTYPGVLEGLATPQRTPHELRELDLDATPTLDQVMRILAREGRVAPFGAPSESEGRSDAGSLSPRTASGIARLRGLQHLGGSATSDRRDTYGRNFYAANEEAESMTTITSSVPTTLGRCRRKGREAGSKGPPSRRIPRKNILLLPTEVLRIVFDRYLAIYCLNPLRLVCKEFDSILRANCVLWHRRLPMLFEDEDMRDPLDRCTVYSAVAAFQAGTVPFTRLLTAFCFNGCCYRAWSQNAVIARQRRLEEMRRDEEVNYAYSVCQAIFFPAEGTSRLGTFIMVTGFMLFAFFAVALYAGYFPPVITFIALWIFFLLCYGMLYLFFCSSPIEPIVLSIIVTIGFNLSTLLLFFYRVQGTHMSWLGCLTPAMLCIACCATYTFLLWHRFAQNNRHSKTVVALAAMATFIPVLVLVFLILLGSELDGAIIVPPSAAPPPSPPQLPPPPPSPLDPRPGPGGGGGSANIPTLEACARVVAGTVRLSGLPLLLIFMILEVNLIYAMRTIGLAELLADEALAAVTLLGFGATGFSGCCFAVILLANATSCQLFTSLLATISLFFSSAILSSAITKDNPTQFRYFLFPSSDLA